MAVKVKVGSLTSIFTYSTNTNAHTELHILKLDFIKTEDEMAVKVKVGSLNSIYTGSTEMLTQNSIYQK